MPRIVIYGAGSIGCYVGLSWLAAGLDIAFIERRTLGETFAQMGGRVVDDRTDVFIAPDKIRFVDDPAALAEADLILLSVKLNDDAQAVSDIRQFAQRDAIVVSLQNGVDNAARLSADLPDMTVVDGMVPFNVVRPEPHVFRKSSAGHVMIEDDMRLQTWLEPASRSTVAPLFRPDMRAVKWSKLLLNLNNPLNALSGISLYDELSQRAWRQLLADAQRECLEIMTAEGIEPAKLGPLPPRALPILLATPDWFFNRTGLRLQRIDRHARSSMADDFAAGRKTEIDFINGMVAALGRKSGIPCPVNEIAAELVRQAEKGGRKIYTAADIRERVNRRLAGGAS